MLAQPPAHPPRKARLEPSSRSPPFRGVTRTSSTLTQSERRSQAEFLMRRLLTTHCALAWAGQGLTLARRRWPRGGRDLGEGATLGVNVKVERWVRPAGRRGSCR